MIAHSFGRLAPTRSWRAASNLDKVRQYTRQSFFVLGLLFGAFGVFTEVASRNYLVAVFLAIAAVAAVLTVARTPELGGNVDKPVVVPLAVTTVSASSAVAIVLAGGGEDSSIFWLAVVVAVPVAALVPMRRMLVATLVVSALFVAVGRPAVGIYLCTAFLFMCGTVYLSAWLLRMVTELDEARGAAAALSVAEERLRFSRDLHDVVGRALSAIAVKSDLAATLSRRGDERAAEQMDEVRALAQESLAEARELVRGYRSIALASELAGARSLLEAAGISTEIVGAADRLPVELAEAAAWVVREGVTNILRHSSARTCTITVEDRAITVVNDGGGRSRSPGGTGLEGLGERVVAVGGTLSAELDDGTFTLSARFSSRTRESR
ncbi:two-component system sensor histidine kinase DesK [Rhodococcus sp. 27YEA15]|uniref:sensor histidine kinase n=1 Tax=Rhodococcus sp. 27YEA15 TaxID=3156259 RepID=UPI003C79F48B